ncbi:MAG: sulfotransferase family 2 domain-containing protein [Pseudomonadota bacterium]|nr:sulfotransferase family 2 domain-containing protein [Pseudomonadota bacterium]
MNLTYQLNSKIWRRVPVRQRRMLMGYLEHYLPRALFQKLLDAMGSGIYRQEVLNTGILFIHVPKAAGTSITRALYNLGGVGHYKAVDARRQNPALFEQLYTFSVIRNPWERLLSAYQFARMGGTGEVSLFNARSLNSQLPDRFDAFVQDWLLAQSPHKLHSIFTPQTHFVCDSAGHCLVDDLFELTALDQLEIALRGRLQRPITFTHANASGNQSLTQAYSSADTIAAVGEYYKDDVALFDFQFPGQQ